MSIRLFSGGKFGGRSFGQSLLAVALCSGLLVLLATTGCKRGGESTEAPSEQTTSAEEEEYAPPPEAIEQPSEAPKPKPKPQAEQQEQHKQEEQQAVVIPDRIEDWVTVHYREARKKGDPRLTQAVIYLANRFRGTAKADIAAQLLRELLTKTPVPKTSYGYGGYEEEYYEEGYSEEEYYEGETEEEYSEESYEEESYEEEYSPEEGEMPEEAGYVPEEGGPGYGRPPAARQQPEIHVASPELIKAIVEALVILDCDSSRQLIREVLSGQFETDDDRLAMETSLEMLAKYKTPANEALLFEVALYPQNFMPPEELKAQQNKQSQQFGPQEQQPDSYPPEEAGEEGYTPEEYEGYTEEPPHEEYYEDYGYGRTSSRRLSARELQRRAFQLLTADASEQTRTKFAQLVLAAPIDLDTKAMVYDFILKFHPANFSAQMLIFNSPAADMELRSTVESYMLGYASAAMAAALGIPPQQAVRGELFLPHRTTAPGRRGPGFIEEPGMMPPEEAYEEGDEQYEEEYRRYMEGDTEEDYEAGPEEMYQGEIPPEGIEGPAGPPQRPPYGPQPPSASISVAVSISRDEAIQLVPKLWNNQFLSLVKQRLGQCQKLSDDPQAIALASTFPSDELRKSIYQLLKANWDAGPATLEETGLSDWVVHDPGLIVLCKSLPRSLPKPSAATPRPGLRRPTGRRRATPPPGMPIRRTPGVPGRVGPPMGPEQMPEEQQYPEEYYEEEGREGPMPPPGQEGYIGRPADAAQQRELAGLAGPDRFIASAIQNYTTLAQKPSEQWMMATARLIHKQCRLLEAAANSGATVSPGDQMDWVPEPHPDEQLIVNYQLDLTQTVKELAPATNVDYLRVRFFKTKRTAIPQVAAGYYRRKLPEPRMHEMGVMAWLDCLYDVPEQGVRRSVDVLVTIESMPTGPVSPQVKRELPVVIELLAVEIKTPAPDEPILPPEQEEQ